MLGENKEMAQKTRLTQICSPSNEERKKGVDADDTRLLNLENHPLICRK